MISTLTTKQDILAKVTPLYEINKFLMEYFQLQLTLGPDAVYEYIKKRQFPKDILEKFHIGYCYDNAQDLYDMMHSKFEDDTLLEQVGFWKITDDGIVMKFAGRLMFPFLDVDNTVYGFSGRSLEDSPEHKYVNTNNCVVFNKHLVLYGLGQALQSNSTIDRWILVEGNTDVMAMHQAGYTTTVAAAGTAVQEYHLLRLKMYSPNIVILMDNDVAGRKATANLQLLAKDLHLNCKISILRDVKDADEAVRTGQINLLKQALG